MAPNAANMVLAQDMKSGVIPPLVTATDRAANGFLSAVLGHFKAKPDEIFCRFLRGGQVEELRWRDIEGSAAAFVGAYRALDLPAGALILIFLRHVPQLYGSFLGAMLGGFRPSFMPCSSPKQDPRLYWSSHSTLFERIRPAVVVADRATLDEMQTNGLDLSRSRLVAIEDVVPAQPAWSIPGEGDIGLLQHSSGTTGLKKGVALSYRAIAAQLDSYAASLEVQDNDVIVSWLPLYHDMGLIACFMLPVYRGIPVVHLDPFEWLARPGSLFDCITRWRGTLAWLPNFAFEYLAAMAGRDAAKYQLSTMRAFINCSETCRPESFDRFAAAFAASGLAVEALQCCYAMAETVYAVTQTRIGRSPRRIWCRRESLERGCHVDVGSKGEGYRELVECGGPIAGLTVGIVDQDRKPLPDGQVGEIAVSGDFLFSNYNEEPERTRGQLRDGLFFTRDLGFVQDGAVYVLGRIDDLIIVNGRNIYAHEIEDLMGKIGGLKPGRSVAVPLLDERNGTQGLVVIAEKLPDTTRSEAELRTEVLNRIFSVVNVMPKSVHLVDEGWLVKTTSGKISREMNAKKIASQLATNR
ncbi:MAG: AMP-binding protein [Reyranella sp.]|nr:AMP-binding protein [Reyranella sp.]